MTKSASDIENRLLAIEDTKATHRDEAAGLLAELRATKEAEDDKFVRAYWEERAQENPDDPEVLRARADLIEKGRDLNKPRGTVVKASTAKSRSEVN